MRQVNVNVDLINSRHHQKEMIVDCFLRGRLVVGLMFVNIIKNAIGTYLALVFSTHIK
jgi:hypothetical protein